MCGDNAYIRKVNEPRFHIFRVNNTAANFEYLSLVQASTEQKLL